MSALGGEMTCDGCLMMSVCDPSPGTVAIFRLDSVAELRKEFQVIFGGIEECLGQLLRRVVCCEMVVEAGKHGVCGRSWHCGGRVGGK